MHIIYTPMAIDGESGYFLSDDEYHKLYAAASEAEHCEWEGNLASENENLRAIISNALFRMRNLVYDLGNA